jgi:hypothetical protein
MALPTRVVTAAEMDLMTPADRAAVVEAGTAKSLDDIPEPFRFSSYCKGARN